MLLQFTQYQQEHSSLQKELQSSVPMEEYERLKQAWVTLQ